MINFKKIFIPITIVWLGLFSIQFLLENSQRRLAASDSFSKDDIIPKFLSIFIFFILFILWKHNTIFNYLCKYGKYSLIIYLVHFPIFIIIENILLNVIKLNILYGFGIFLVTWLLSTFICNICNKVKIFNFIFYPRKYINRVIMKIYN